MRLLEGLVALDLADLKGQFCGKLLADLGMEVIKVEPPAGDPVRRLGPFARGQPGLERSLRFAYLNSGKKSLTLDVATAEGRDLLLHLVEQADVLLETGQPGELEQLDLGHARLLERNPRLVITSVTGFGQDGPRRHYLCPDIVGFAMGGLMYISGDAALPPVKAPETQAYYFACVYAALGTLLALWQRRSDRRGRVVDISIQEAVASQEHLIRTAGFDGKSIRRHGSQHEHVAPANIFPTKDGFVYLFVSRQHWRQFLKVWPDHPRELEAAEWEANDFRRARAEWINELVAGFTRQYAKQDLVQLMQKHGIPCLPVNTPSEFIQDEQTQFRKVFAGTSHPVLGDYVQVGFPSLIDGQRLPVSPPPLLGQHTRQVLKERLGLSDDRIQRLRSLGVI